MFSILFVPTGAMNELHSYSTAVVQGGGTPFASYDPWTHEQTPLTQHTFYIYCENPSLFLWFPLRYGYNWSPVFGHVAGVWEVQVSGKYNPGKYNPGNIYTLVFTTNRGRSLSAGQPYHVSFNFYPAHMGNELRPLSCRFNGADITSIGAYWGLVYLEKAGNYLWGKSMSL
uniref:Uncharacterized protein n=1 Tax=Oncorhynchus kisutch TaxID=8019 RepID=A0A8C7HA95_ONCKI